MANKPSNAAVQYERLSTNDRSELLDQIFDILEFDDEGKPGTEWSSDTLQSVGDAFAQYGVTFTEASE